MKKGKAENGILEKPPMQRVPQEAGAVKDTETGGKPGDSGVRKG